MNTSISDINYSLTGGKYSALNSKLYLMDSFDTHMEDGSSAQSTTYEHSGSTVEGNPVSHGVEDQFVEQQSGSQSNVVNANNAIVDTAPNHIGAESSEANPAANHINAVASSTPVMGINEDAVKTMAAALGEGPAGDGSSFGNGGPGGAGGAAVQAMSGANGVSTNTNTNTSTNNTNTIERHDGTNINNTYNNTYNMNVTDNSVHNQTTINNYGDGCGGCGPGGHGGGIEINIEQILNTSNTLINNTVTNIDNVVNNVIDVDSVINNVLNEVNINILNNIDIHDVTGGLGDIINNTTNVLGDVLNNTTNIVGDVLNDTTNILDNTTNILGDVINNTVVNLTGDILGDLLNPIEFNLDVDLGLNSNLISDLSLGDLGGVLDLVDNNVLANLTFDLNSDLLNLHLDTDSILNSPLVTNLQDGLSDVLNHVDALTSHIPLVDAADNLLDLLNPVIPFDQLSLNLNDFGTIDPTNLLNITNETNLTEDLGTVLSFDDNALHNSLNILSDEGLQIDELLQLNNIDLLDTVQGVTPLDNLGEVVNNLVGDVVNDVSHVLDHGAGGNLVENLIDNNPISDVLDDGIHGVDPINVVHDVVNSVADGGVLDDIINHDDGGGLLDSVLNHDGGGLLDSVVNPDDGDSIVDNLLDNQGLDPGLDPSGLLQQALDSLDHSGGGNPTENNVIENVINNVVNNDNPIDSIIQNLENSFNSGGNENTNESTNINDISGLLTGNDNNAADAIFDTIASTINDVPVSLPETVLNEVDMGGITNPISDVLDHHLGGLLGGHLGI